MRIRAADALLGYAFVLDPEDAADAVGEARAFVEHAATVVGEASK